MPFDDEEDDEPLVVGARSGGGDVAEWRAAAEGNNEPLDGDCDMSHPQFPANTTFEIGPKPFLPAQMKIAWFRLVKPDWSVITEEIEITPKAARFRATIMNSQGRVMATATKSWAYSKSPEHYITAAETSAVSRALELCGFSAERALSGIKFE